MISSLALALWVVALIVSSFLAQTVYHAYTTPLRKVPGPWHSLFTNLVLKYHILTGRRIHYIHAMHAKHGRIVRIAPTEVAISDLDAHREMHRIGSGYLKDPWYQAVNSSDSPGIFATIDPKAHAARRKLFAQAFSKTYLRQHWEASVREKAAVTVSKIKRDAQRGCVDVLKWFTFMATDVIGHLAFGESFRMLDKEEKTPYIRLLETALMQGGIGAELPWLKVVGRLIPVAAVQEFWKADARLLEYGALALKNNGGLNESKATIFAKMTNEGETGALSDLDIKQEASNLIVAGSDTTANTLTYLIWSVLKQPLLHSRLRDEASTLPGDFSDADVEGLPLLNAVIAETLRLYGAAPGSLPRSVPKGGRELCGLFLPADTTVSTQAYSLHRDAALYPDPLSFNPERWLSGEDQTSDQKAAFFPFGAGARSCIGIHLAMMELRLTTALFVRECPGARLAVNQTDEGMEMQNYFLITPVGHQCLVTMP